jgi:hypothetical protein
LIDLCLTLPQVVELDLRACSKLQSLRIDSPLLKIINLKKCYELVLFEVTSSAMNQLDLSMLDKLVSCRISCVALKFLNLTGCLGLSKLPGFSKSESDFETMLHDSQILHHRNNLDLLTWFDGSKVKITNEVLDESSDLFVGFCGLKVRNEGEINKRSHSFLKRSSSI